MFEIIRYVLNSKKRLEQAVKWGLSSEISEIPNLFELISMRIKDKSYYPLPNSILIEEIPEAKEFFEKLPEELNKQEEVYYSNQFKVMMSRLIVLKKLAIQRKSIEDYQEISRELRGLLTPDRLYNVEETGFTFKNFSEFKEKDDKFFDSIIPTPFPTLSSQLKGGFLPGGMYAFESTTKSFKTMLMLYFCVWYFFQGYKIGYVSLEISTDYGRERLGQMLKSFKKPEEAKDYRAIGGEELKNILLEGKGEFFFEVFLPNTTFDVIEEFLEDKNFQILIIDPPKYLRPIETSSGMKDWEKEKILFTDLFTYCKKRNIVLIIPSYQNREGDKNIRAKFDSDVSHGAGSFDTNMILEAKYLMIPSKNEGRAEGEDRGVSLKPLYMRRGEGDNLITLTFHPKTLLFSERTSMISRVYSTPESFNSKQREG